MKTFKELFEFKKLEDLETNAYIAGAEQYYNGYLYLANPFERHTKAFREFFDGYHDAEFLSSLERFEDRVAN